jgi:hypothetical protein
MALSSDDIQKSVINVLEVMGTPEDELSEDMLEKIRDLVGRGIPVDTISGLILAAIDNQEHIKASSAAIPMSDDQRAEIEAVLKRNGSLEEVEKTVRKLKKKK